MAHLAKKSLGQNFLTSSSVIHKMVSSAEVNTADLVLEIGPGKGALTKALLEQAKRVIAIEKDSQLVLLLQEKFKDEIAQEKLILISDDALEIDIKKLTNNQPYKIVANIPYYITGALLRTFLSSDHPPTVLVFLMQKEVAERIVNRDGKESILSLSVQAYGTPVYIQKVSNKAFSPSPKISSAILKVHTIAKDIFKGDEESLFFEIIKLAFAHKRKTALKNLSLNYPKEFLEKILEKNALKKTVRAEDINFQQWLLLLGDLKGYTDKHESLNLAE